MDLEGLNINEFQYGVDVQDGVDEHEDHEGANVHIEDDDAWEESDETSRDDYDSGEDEAYKVPYGKSDYEGDDHKFDAFTNCTIKEDLF